MAEVDGTAVIRPSPPGSAAEGAARDAGDPRAQMAGLALGGLQREAREGGQASRRVQDSAPCPFAGEGSVAQREEIAHLNVAELTARTRSSPPVRTLAALARCAACVREPGFRTWRCALCEGSSAWRPLDSPFRVAELALEAPAEVERPTAVHRGRARRPGTSNCLSAYRGRVMSPPPLQASRAPALAPQCSTPAARCSSPPLPTTASTSRVGAAPAAVAARAR